MIHESAKYLIVTLVAALIFCLAYITFTRSSTVAESPTGPSASNGVSPSRPSNDQTETSQDSRPEKPVRASRADARLSETVLKFIGCWSSGNGNFMSITSTTLQTRNSYEPLKYKLLTDELAKERGVYLLEIAGVDKSHEIAKLIAFRSIGDTEMDGSIFDSFEAFRNDHPIARQGRWVRTKCSTVGQFLK